MRLSQLYLWTIAGTIIAAIALLLNELLAFVFVPSALAIVGILALVLSYAVIALGCAAAYENGRAPRLMRSGMIIGAIALVCGALIALTPSLQETSGPLKLFIWLTVWPCLMSISGPLLLLPMDTGWRWRMRAGTLIMLTVLGWFIACAFSFYPDPQGYYDQGSWELARRYENGATQIGVALGMLTGALLAITLIVGILGALTGQQASSQPVARLAYWLQCPRCGREQEALTGDHRCIACNLRTRIEFV
jgi:hypothetical protein